MQSNEGPNQSKKDKVPCINPVSRRIKFANEENNPGILLSELSTQSYEEQNDFKGKCHTPFQFNESLKSNCDTKLGATCDQEHGINLAGVANEDLMKINRVSKSNEVNPSKEITNFGAGVTEPESFKSIDLYHTLRTGKFVDLNLILPQKDSFFLGTLWIFTKEQLDFVLRSEGVHHKSKFTFSILDEVKKWLIQSKDEDTQHQSDESNFHKSSSKNHIDWTSKAINKINMWKMLASQSVSKASIENYDPDICGPLSVLFPKHLIDFLTLENITTLSKFLQKKKTASSSFIVALSNYRQQHGMVYQKISSLVRYIIGILLRIKVALCSVLPATPSTATYEWASSPLVVLSESARQFFINSIGLKDAKNILNVKSTHLADKLSQWRNAKEMCALKNGGALVTISVWKTHIKEAIDMEKNTLDNFIYTLGTQNESDSPNLYGKSPLNLLKPEVVQFLHRVGIRTPLQLNIVDKRETSPIVASLMQWRAEKGLAYIQRKSCTRLLYEWMHLINKKTSRKRSHGTNSPCRYRHSNDYSSDPIEVLSNAARTFLRENNVLTADQFLSIKSSKLAILYVQWRSAHRRPILKGTGAVASISSWKRNVQNAMIRAEKISHEKQNNLNCLPLKKPKNLSAPCRCIYESTGHTSNSGIHCCVLQKELKSLNERRFHYMQSYMCYNNDFNQPSPSLLGFPYREVAVANSSNDAIFYFRLEGRGNGQQSWTSSSSLYMTFMGGKRKMLHPLSQYSNHGSMRVTSSEPFREMISKNSNIKVHSKVPIMRDLKRKENKEIHQDFFHSKEYNNQIEFEGISLYHGCEFIDLTSYHPYPKAENNVNQLNDFLMSFVMSTTKEISEESCENHSPSVELLTHLDKKSSDTIKKTKLKHVLQNANVYVWKFETNGESSYQYLFRPSTPMEKGQSVKLILNRQLSGSKCSGEKDLPLNMSPINVANEYSQLVFLSSKREIIQKKISTLSLFDIQQVLKLIRKNIYKPLVLKLDSLLKKKRSIPTSNMEGSEDLLSRVSKDFFHLCLCRRRIHWIGKMIEERYLHLLSDLSASEINSTFFMRNFSRVLVEECLGIMKWDNFCNTYPKLFEGLKSKSGSQVLHKDIMVELLFRIKSKKKLERPFDPTVWCSVSMKFLLQILSHSSDYILSSFELFDHKRECLEKIAHDVKKATECIDVCSHKSCFKQQAAAMAKLAFEEPNSLNYEKDIESLHMSAHEPDFVKMKSIVTNGLAVSPHELQQGGEIEDDNGGLYLKRKKRKFIVGKTSTNSLLCDQPDHFNQVLLLNNAAKVNLEKGQMDQNKIYVAWYLLHQIFLVMYPVLEELNDETGRIPPLIHSFPNLVSLIPGINIPDVMEAIARRVTESFANVVNSAKVPKEPIKLFDEREKNIGLFPSSLPIFFSAIWPVLNQKYGWKVVYNAKSKESKFVAPKMKQNHLTTLLLSNNASSTIRAKESVGKNEKFSLNPYKRVVTCMFLWGMDQQKMIDKPQVFTSSLTVKEGLHKFLQYKAETSTHEYVPSKKYVEILRAFFNELLPELLLSQNEADYLFDARDIKSTSRSVPRYDEHCGCEYLLRFLFVLPTLLEQSHLSQSQIKLISEKNGEVMDFFCMRPSKIFCETFVHRCADPYGEKEGHDIRPNKRTKLNSCNEEEANLDECDRYIFKTHIEVINHLLYTKKRKNQMDVMNCIETYFSSISLGGHLYSNGRMLSKKTTESFVRLLELSHQIFVNNGTLSSHMS